jgi:hypothetical protein
MTDEYEQLPADVEAEDKEPFPFRHAGDLLRKAIIHNEEGKGKEAFELLLQAVLATMDEATSITDELRNRVDELESQLASIDP